MINLNPIPKKIQERMLEKMKALGRESSTILSSTNPNRLTPEKMNTRTTFIKMVSGHTNSVTLMGGKLTEDRNMAAGYNDIYGPRIYKETEEEEINKLAADQAQHVLGDDVPKKKSPEEFAINNYKFGPKAKTISNDGSRPMPGIKSIDVSFRGGLKAHRECTVSWTCWDFEELMQLMPHFLAHGKTVMVQWGWIYDEFSLQNIPSFLKQENGATFIESNAFNSSFQKEVIESGGDFDMVTGVIKNFEFSTRADGGFDCSTVLTSLGVNMMANPDGALGALNPTVKYALSKQDPESEAKLQEAADKAILAGDDTKLINLNATVSLKIFLTNIDMFIFNEARGEYGKQKSLTGTDGRGMPMNGSIWWTPNKFIYIVRSKETKNKEGKLEFDKKSQEKDVWVRWGWFEDNILSKFLTVTSAKGEILTQFRSVENTLDRDGKPILDKDGNPIYESTKIKSHQEMQSVSLRDYILPGKFSPQSEKFEITIAGRKETFNGDTPDLVKLANIVNDVDNFPQFDVKVGEPYQDKETMTTDEMIAQNQRYFKEYPDMKGKHIDDRRRHYYEVYGNPTDVNTKSKFGYMRNMLVNTKAIKKAFGIGGEFNVESINILESLESLFDILNNKLHYWDFQLVSDEVETDRIKIIDETTTWLNFNKSITSQATRFGATGGVVDKPGVFYFPIWRNDSIVSGQTLTAKIPTTLQLAAMYGANMDITSDVSKNTYIERAGTAAGALYNRSPDNRNAGLNMAFVNPGTENIGNENGLESEPILMNGGVDIKTNVKENSLGVTKARGDNLKDIAEKLKAAAGGSADVFYDSSKPSPFFDTLTKEQKEELFNSDKAEEEAQKAGLKSGQIGPFIPTPLAKYKQLFSSKYDSDYDMRSTYIQTINTLINVWDEDSTADNKPLSVLFDLELVVDGIGGISPGNSFHSTYLPVEYQNKSVFQVKNVTHTVDGTGWKTTVSGMMRSTLKQVLSDVSIDDKKKDLFDNLTGNILGVKKEESKPNKNSVAEEINKKLPSMSSL
tara:strand:+ start:5386 stop:8442 length:3057 start_codon:yes stop_codon:yes gene_type:complete